MPVLITITAVNFLFGGPSDGPASFLNPESLRSKLNDAIEPEDSTTRVAAMQIVDELVAAVESYQLAVDAAADKAILQSKTRQTSARSTAVIFSKIDRNRSQAMQDIIRLRGRLAELLGQGVWSRVFES